MRVITKQHCIHLKSNQEFYIVQEIFIFNYFLRRKELKHSCATIECAIKLIENL